MIEEGKPSVPNGISPFERIRRTNAAGAEYWSSRDFAQVLGYSDCRNFGQVILKARAACFNGGQQIEDRFIEITERIGCCPRKVHKRRLTTMSDVQRQEL